MVNGLPAHVLVVHAVVVLIPLAALMAVLGALWPAARRRLGVLTPLVALVALVSVPLATQAGEWLEEHVPESPLVEQHAGYGDAVLGWAVGLFAVTCVLWFGGMRADRHRVSEGPGRAADPVSAWAGRPWARAVAAAVTVVVAAGSTFAVYRAGDSGARAAWQDRITTGADAGHADG
jgi:hypothetical protein